MAVRRWSEVLREFEGVAAFLYPDITALPTCGVGHACQTPQEAVAIFGDPRAEQDWHTIKTALRGQSLHLYAPLTVSRLTDEQIEAIEAADVAETGRRLLAACPDSALWPVGVRDAALDIEYNVKGGIGTFPHMLSAIRRGDWQGAAALSGRPQLQAARNQWTVASILSAA